MSDPVEANAARRRLLRSALGWPLVACSPFARNSAQAADAIPSGYPNRPLRFIIPFPIGGTSDLLARLIGAHLGAAIGQPVVIESKPGAAGAIAMQYAAKAAPDGYTMFFANNGTNAILRSKQRHDGVDLLHSFAPVIKFATLPIVIVVSANMGVTTLAELLARVRRDPGALAFATSDVGSTSHLAATLLFQRADVKLIHVPYAGTALGVKDTLAGEVQILFTHIATVAALIHSGRLVALAVTGTHRMPAFPDIPTVAESGFAGFDVTTWHGVLVPIGTPREIVLRLHDELAHIVADKDVRSQIVEMGMDPTTGTPEQFAADLETDVARWTRIVRDAGGAEE